jgi:hypothetical protein
MDLLKSKQGLIKIKGKIAISSFKEPATILGQAKETG